MEVGIKEAKTTLSKLLHEVQNGNRIFITNHGERIVELVPVVAPSKPIHYKGLGMYSDVKLPATFGTAKWKKAATAHVLKLMELD